MSTVIFVQGACVRDQSWWWQRMHAPLARRGLGTAAVDLPSCQMPAGAAATLHDDARAVVAAVDRADGPVLLCGHSYGGMVITEAGDDERVSRLLYVTSVMADGGQSQADLIGAEPAPWMSPGEDGTVGVDPELVRELFLNDCDEAATEGALARLTRQSVLPFTQPPRRVAWQMKPATYFVCTRDLATPAEVQRRRVRENAELVEFEAGHHPFLSRPEAFADSIAAEVDRVA